jgi:hypothetical protein
LEATQELAQAVPQVEPAATVKLELLRRVREAQERRHTGPLLRPAVAWQAALAVSLVGLLATLLTVTLLTRHDMAALETRTHQLSATVQRERLQQASVRAQEAGEQYALVSLLAAPDRHVYWAERHFVYPQVRGMVMTAADERWGLLTAVGLEPLPQDKRYQVWLQRDAQRISGGTFTVDETGWGQITLRPAEPLSNFQSLLVTVEPREGSALPTSPPVFRARLFSDA